MSRRKDFFNIRNCNVCVVGGAGFLGSHLVDHLIEDRGCKVIVLDNLVSGRKEFVHKEAKLDRVDITRITPNSMAGWLLSHEVDYLFNYAAYPYVPDSYSDPLKVVDVTGFSAIKIIEACHLSGTPILQVSSAELYGSTHTEPDNWFITKEDRVSPRSTYGSSKAMVDFFVQCRWKESGVKAIALRQFNCVGERETHPYVIPEIISQIQHNIVPEVRLGNNTKRDFMYVGDAVKMAVELLEKGSWGEVYNLGSESNIEIYELARLCAQIMDAGHITVTNDHTRNRPWDIWHLLSNNNKIYECVESRPNTSLREAIYHCYQWYVEQGCRWPWEKA